MGEEERKDEGAQRPEEAPEEQPTRVMRPARHRRLLAAVLARLRKRVPGVLSGVVAVALVVVPIALITLFVITLVGGGDDGDERERGLAQIQSADSSWILGQSSLVAYPGYLAIAELADALGDERYTAYEDLLAYIERQRRLALKEKQIREAIRLLQICEEARREYQRELAAAARERREKERRIEKKRKAIERKIERLREKYRVDPGEECAIAELAELFECEIGYPFPKPKLPKPPPPPPPPPPPAPCELPPILEGVDISQYI